MSAPISLEDENVFQKLLEEMEHLERGYAQQIQISTKLRENCQAYEDKHDAQSARLQAVEAAYKQQSEKVGELQRFVTEAANYASLHVDISKRYEILCRFVAEEVPEVWC